MKTATVRKVPGGWSVNGGPARWQDSTPFYVVYYALRWHEGFREVERVEA